MTLRSLLCLDYGTGICVGRVARNSCINIYNQSYESEVRRAHEILNDHIQRLCLDFG